MSVNLGTAVGYLELNSDRWVSSYNTARQQMQTLADSSQSMSSRFQAAGQMLTSAGSTLTTHVTAPLLALGGAATSMSMQAETSMAKVNSILQLSSSEWTKYQTTLKQGANDIGMAYSDYAEAAYSAISAGVKQADVTNFLTQSNKLAKGGLTDLATATDLLTTVQNAYGLSQKDMQHVSDVLIQTQNKGKTTVGELGSAMGKVIPTANSLGVSVEQLGASYAIMTAGGISTAESTTYLNSMLNELGKSGSGVDKILREQTGKSFKELMESGKSTGDVLQILSDYAEKSGKSLTDLFSSAEAGKAATALMKDGVKGFNEQLDGMINSTGACDKAFKTMNSTAKEQLTQSINKLKNAMVEIGNVMLPLVGKIAQVVGKFADWLSNLAQTNPALLQVIVVIGGVVAAIGPLLLILGSLASAIGNILELRTLLSGSSMLSGAITRVTGLFSGLRNVIMGSVVPAIQSLWAFMLANPITFVIAAIAALVAGFVYLWNNCESFRNFWINLWDNIVSTVSKIPGQVQKIFNELPGKISGALDSTGDALINWGYSISGGVGDTMTDLYGVFRDSFDGMVEYIKNITTIVKDIFTGNWGAIPGDVEKLFTGMCNSVGNILSGLANIVGDAFAMVNDAIQAVLGKIWGGVIDWASNINSGLGQAFLNAYYTISDTFDGIMTVIRDVTTIISDIFRGDWSSAVNHLKTLWNDLLFYAKMIFGDIVESIKGFIVGAKDFVVDGVSNIGKSISNWASDTYNTISNWASNTISAVGQWFNELPSKIGYALGFALGVIAGWVVNTWNYFATNIPLWINSIGQWFSELPSKIEQWLTTTYNNIVTWGTNMYNKAKETGTNFVNGIIQFFKELPTKVQTWFDNTYNNTVKWGSNVVSKGKETGTNFVNSIVDFVKTLPTVVLNWLTQTYNKVVSWATQMGNKARETGSTFVSKVGSTIQSLPGQVWSYLSQTISKASTFVSQFGQKATQAARNFTTNIVNGVRNIPNQMLSIGRNIVQGIWRGISGAAGWLRSQISNFASGIIKGFKSAFKINSPSKIMRDVIGKGIVEGIGVGIDQKEGDLLTQANKLAGSVVDVMSGNIATANLFDTAKNLTTSMNIATNQATGQDKVSKFDSLLHVENLTINDDKDIETLASDLAFYLKRKNVLTV